MSIYDNNKLSRDDGTKEVETVENSSILTETKITTTSTIVTPIKRKNRRNFIFFITFLVLDLVIVGFIIWQIASIFSGLS